MIKTKEQIKVNTEQNANGETMMHLADLRDFEENNPRLRMYSHVKLNPGETVEFHVHEGECEYYYILKGKGLYDDNGEKIEVSEGTITFTPSGSGHGITNTGDEVLEFMALVILD